MQKFHFFSLPRSIQERFIESTAGQGVPTPLLIQSPVSNPWAVVLAVTAALFFTLCAGFARIGYGDLEHRWALNPPWAIFVYSGLLCVASATLAGAITIRACDSNVPFRRGLYIFPVGVIDARSEVIEHYPVQELVDLSTTGTRLRMRFSGGADFEFRGVEPKRGGKIKVTLLDTQQRLNDPSADLSNRELALLDPLFDTGYQNPFSSHESMGPATTFWSIRWFMLVLAMGSAAGVGLWKLRNMRCAERLYINARALNTTRAYRDYLARGGTNSEIRDVLLPKAELREAQAAGNVEAIEHTLDGHQNSKIVREIEGVLRTALLSEFNEARRVGKLSQLREFRKDDRYASLISVEVEQARHEQYRAAWAGFQALLKCSPELTVFFERLLAYAEKHGPQVEIRFRRRIPASVQMADVRVQKSPYCSSPSVLPAQYFDAEHFAPREAKVAAAISERFTEAFSRDILSFELAGAWDDDDNPAAEVTAPTLLITHRTELSAPYTSRKPPGVFVGVGLLFKAELLIPGDSASPHFETSTWSPPNLKKLEAEGWGPAELYASMVEDGFSQFLKRYLASLCRAPKLP